jgi:hypothetical protein
MIGNYSQQLASVSTRSTICVRAQRPYQLVIILLWGVCYNLCLSTKVWLVSTVINPNIIIQSIFINLS